MSFGLICDVLHETDEAILIKDPESEEEIWIPLSQVDAIHGNKPGPNCEVVMSDWIAKKKGLA